MNGYQIYSSNTCDVWKVPTRLALLAKLQSELWSDLTASGATNAGAINTSATSATSANCITSGARRVEVASVWPLRL